MKCIKNQLTGEIKRVSDKDASRLIANGQSWWYCSKEEWKEKVRGPVRSKARKFASKAEERRYHQLKKEAA